MGALLGYAERGERVRHRNCETDYLVKLAHGPPMIMESVSTSPSVPRGLIFFFLWSPMSPKKAREELERFECISLEERANQNPAGPY